MPGLGSAEAKEASVKLKVGYMKDALVWAQEDTVKEGQNVSLICSVDAQPPPHEVIWERDVSTSKHY